MLDSFQFPLHTWFWFWVTKTREEGDTELSFMTRGVGETRNPPTQCVLLPYPGLCGHCMVMMRGLWRWSCSFGGQVKTDSWVMFCVQEVFLQREMNRPHEESRPKLSLMTHFPLSSSLAWWEKHRSCSHTTHRRNAQFAAFECGAKAEQR